MASTATHRKLIDSPELSGWIGVPHATLDQWAYRKVGPPFIKVGRHRRYDPDAVQAWLDEHTFSGDAA